MALAGFVGVPGFLSLNRPVEAECLVVEGWVSDYALEFAAKEFRHGQYRRLYTTGGPLTKASYLAEYKNNADIAAATLGKLGLGSNIVVSVPAPEVKTDRTYASAVALRRRCEERGEQLTALNVVTIGSHARRTRFIYQKVFGKGVQVGVLAVREADYKPSRWWRYSAGWRDVIGESVGYLHARLVL